MFSSLQVWHGEDLTQAETRDATGIFKALREKCRTIFAKDQSDVTTNRSRFISHWFNTWRNTGDVEDADRPGRPRLVQEHEAWEAARLITTPRPITYKKGKKTMCTNVYYTTIQEAIDDIPRLKQLVDRLGVNAEQLREAIHFFVPGFEQRRVQFKIALTDEEKDDRVKRCAELLEEYAKDPFMLYRMVFVDEMSVFNHGDNHDHVHVWVMRGDTAFDDVAHIPMTSLKKTVKAHVIAAVTANPEFKSKGGLVYQEFTTGTTDINRRHNRRLDGSLRVGDYTYGVSMLHFQKQDIVICATLTPQGWELVTHCIHIGPCVAFVRYAGGSKARCQHNATTHNWCNVQGCHCCRRVVDVIFMHPHQSVT